MNKLPNSNMSNSYTGAGVMGLLRQFLNLCQYYIVKNQPSDTSIRRLGAALALSLAEC